MLLLSLALEKRSITRNRPLLSTYRSFIVDVNDSSSCVYSDASPSELIRAVSERTVKVDQLLLACKVRVYYPLGGRNHGLESCAQDSQCKGENRADGERT